MCPEFGAGDSAWQRPEEPIEFRYQPFVSNRTLIRGKAMSAIRKSEAIEKLARAVEAAASDTLADIYTEVFPERQAPEVAGAKGKAVADDLARHIRNGLAPEEIVDLWNVVFPADRHVHYDEEEGIIRYNEGEAWYAKA
jgi:hypothetical protein